MFSGPVQFKSPFKNHRLFFEQTLYIITFLASYQLVIVKIIGPNAVLVTFPGPGLGTQE